MKIEIEAGGWIIPFEVESNVDEDELDEEIFAYVQDFFYPAHVEYEWRKVGD